MRCRPDAGRRQGLGNAGWRQQQRFARTYADLLASRRYGAAAGFFLEQLYGPVDFARRDVQFARVVPALVRLFPGDVVEAVAVLANLHALTESLDTAMATHAVHARWTPDDCARAWRVTGRRADRETQIASILALAMRLDRLTRSAVLRESLRLMRVPARAAGLEDLQRFLETGFDAFRAMHGAAEFTQTIETRERAFVAAMFPAEPFRDGMSGSDAIRSALSQGHRVARIGARGGHPGRAGAEVDRHRRARRHQRGGAPGRGAESPPQGHARCAAMNGSHGRA
ncbi:FFLEELY motif protein [Rhizobacter fulvus]